MCTETAKWVPRLTVVYFLLQVIQEFVSGTASHMKTRISITSHTRIMHTASEYAVNMQWKWNQKLTWQNCYHHSSYTIKISLFHCCWHCYSWKYRRQQTHIALQHINFFTASINYKYCVYKETTNVPNSANQYTSIYSPRPHLACSMEKQEMA